MFFWIIWWIWVFYCKIYLTQNLQWNVYDICICRCYMFVMYVCMCDMHVCNICVCVTCICGVCVICMYVIYACVCVLVILHYSSSPYSFGTGFEHGARLTASKFQHSTPPVSAPPWGFIHAHSYTQLLHGCWDLCFDLHAGISPQ